MALAVAALTLFGGNPAPAQAQSVTEIPSLTFGSNTAGTALTLNWDATVTGTHRYGIRWKSGSEAYTAWPGGWGDNARASFVLSDVATFTMPKSGVSSQIALTGDTAYTIEIAAFNSSGTVLARSEFTATTAKVQVSNTAGTADSGAVTVDNLQKRAQGFVTGSNYPGYDLAGIGLVITTASYTKTPTVELWSASGTNPSAKVADLTSPTLTAASTGLQTFTAPSGTRLDNNTRYFLVVSCASGQCVNPASHAANGEDAGASIGWSIDDAYLTQVSQTVWNADGSGRSMRINVYGGPLPTPEVPGAYWTPDGPTSVKFAFSAATDATSYELKWKTRNAADSTYSDTGSSVVSPAEGNPGSAYIDGLTANTDYTIRLEAKGTTNGVPVVVARSVLDVSTGVSVSSNSDGTALTLDWGTPTGATGNIAYYGIRWKSGSEADAGWAGGWGDTARSSFVASSATRTFTLPKSGVSSQVALTKGTAYTIHLYAFSGAGRIHHRMEFTAVPLPTVPDATAARKSDTALTVTWGAVANATAYEVAAKTGAQSYPDEGGGRLCEVSNPTSDADLTCDLSGLTLGEEYTIRVRALGAGSALLAESVITGNTLGPILEVLDTGNQIKATWAAPTGAVDRTTAYTVALSQDDGASYHPVCTPLHPTLTCTFTPTFYSTYVGREHIVRLNVDGPGGPLTTYASIATTLPKVAGLTATPGAGKLDLSWTAVNNAGGYIVQWKAAGQEYATTRQATPASSSYTVYNADRAQQTIRVRATHATRTAATGPWSAEASATPLPPPQIPGITWSRFSATSLKVESPIVTGATSYVLQWKTRNAADSTYRDTGVTVGTPRANGVSITISGLTALTDYTIRLEGMGRTSDNQLVTFGQSILDVTTTPLVPDFEVSVASATSLKVDWGAYTGATVDAYRVQWRTSDGRWEDSSDEQLAASARTHTITGLTTDETYIVRVAAYTTVENEGITSLGSLLARSDAVRIVLTDKPGYVLSKETMTLAEGASDTVTIRLKKQPTHDVRINPSSSHGLRFTAKPTSGDDDWLRFTPTNWSTPQSVTVTALEDEIAWFSSQQLYVRWSVRTEGEDYRKIRPKSVKLTIADNDTAGVEIDTTGLEVTEGLRANQPGGLDCYTVELTSQPEPGRIFYVYPKVYVGGERVSGGSVVVGPTVLAFTGANWKGARDVCVSAARDGIYHNPDLRAEIRNYIGQVKNSTYHNITELDSVDVEVEETDPPLRVRPKQINVFVNITRPVEMRLLAPPTANVTLNLASTDPTVATISGSSLTFTPSNWNQYQGITVTSKKKGTSTVGLSSVTTTDATFTGLAGTAVRVPVCVFDMEGYLAAVEKYRQRGTWEGVEFCTGIDSHGQAQEPTFSIKTPPVFMAAAEDRTATVGAAFSYTAPEAQPLQGDAVTYAASLADDSALPAWLGFTASTRTFAGTPAAGDVGVLSVKVTATDNADDPSSSETTFTLTVEAAAVEGNANGQANGEGSNPAPQQSNSEPANSAPSFDDSIVTTLKVDENSAASTNVGSPITATDPDDGDTVTYSLTGTDAASFAIGSSTGQITTVANVEYNYEAKSSYSLSVKASDGKLSNSAPVTVKLNDVNEAPALADGTVTALSVNENSASGTKVGSAFTAADPDASDTLAYSLSGTDAASFVIGALTGQIATKSGVTYNHEAKSSYSLTVVATDAGGLTDSVAVTVSLNDVAEAPTVPNTGQFKNHAATVGQTFSLTLPAADENSGDGGPYEYLLWHRGHGQNFMDQAINGLSFNAATRTLSGTPTAAGVWKLSYVVHDDDTDRSVEDRFRARTNLQVTVSQ